MTLKKTLLIYLATYFLLFVLVCAVQVPISKRTTDLARERVIEEKKRQAELCLDEMTKQMEKYNQIASAMSVNKDVILLAMSNNNPASTVNTIRVKNQMQYYVGMLDHLETCLLVMQSDRTVISSDFISREFLDDYGVCFSFGNMDAEEAWQMINSNTQSIACIRLDRVGLEGYEVNEPCLFFLARGTFDVNKTNVITAVFVMRVKSFLSRTIDMAGEESLILFCDDKGQTLCTWGEDSEKLKGLRTGNTVSIDGRKYVAVSNRSAYTGMELLLGIPEENIYENTLKLTDYIPFYLGGGLLSVALFCVIYAIAHYHQMSKLVRLGESISDLPYEKAGTYSYLQNVMNHVSDQNKEYFFKYTQTDLAYLNCMLMNACIHGVYLTDQIRELEKYIGPLTRFVMAALQYTPQASEKTKLNVESHLRNSFNQVQVISIHPRPQIALIILNIENESTGFRERLTQELDVLCRQGEILRAGISDTLSGVDMIQEGYQQTQLMLQRLEAGTFGGAASYVPDENAVSSVSIATMNRLNDLVLYGKQEEVDAFFDEMEHMVASGSVSGEQFAEICYSLQMVLSCLAADLKVTYDKETETAYPSASLKRLRLRASQLVAQVQQRQHMGNEKLYNRTIEIMSNMMSDPALNASMLATNLGISEKYVYRIVKDWSGRSFGSCLEEMRIKKAEELLLNTDMSNEQIAEAVGFASLTTFYRSFRKAHNMPPAAWRNIVKESDVSGNDVLEKMPE